MPSGEAQRSSALTWIDHTSGGCGQQPRRAPEREIRNAGRPTSGDALPDTELGGAPWKEFDSFALEVESSPSQVVTECRRFTLDHFRLALSGDFDAFAADTFDRSIDVLLAAGHRGVVVDLGAITFLDSSAIRSLLRAKNAVTQVDGCFSVDRVPSPADRVLEIAGLSTYLLGPHGGTGTSA
jgi:anti-sigma B factor antagonist